MASGFLLVDQAQRYENRLKQYFDQTAYTSPASNIRSGGEGAGVLSRNFNLAVSPPTDLAPARHETAAKMSFVEENRQRTRPKAQVVSMSNVDIDVSLSCGWYAEKAQVRVQFVERG